MGATGLPPVPDLPRPLPWLAHRGRVPPLDALRANADRPVGMSAPAGPGEPSGKVDGDSGSSGAAAGGDPPGEPTAPPPSPPATSKGAGSARGTVPVRRGIRLLVWARRCSQTVFLLIFLYFLAQTAFRGTFATAAGEPVRLPLPVEAFFLFDPFVAITTLLATHTVYRGLAWALVVLALTFVFGRVFCGWICPFGTLHHFISWVWPSRYLKSNRRVRVNRTAWWQSGKYYLLWGLLGAALAGSAIGGLFDPISLAVRGLGLGILAALQYVGLRSAALAADTNAQALQHASDSAQDFLSRVLWTTGQSYYHQVWLILVVCVTLFFLNRVIPRFWCRALCPLGALLGLFSRFSLFGMEKRHELCTDCNLCLIHCQGADSPEGGVKHRQDECHLCFNCENACPEGVIRFRFLPRRRSTQTKPNLERRTTLASVAAGAVAIPTFRIGNWPDRAYDERVIRPPGSLEERSFLERCVRCAECMKVCPNNALHPALFEAGIEGLWTPILIPRIGYCEFSCVLCGQVCPTGAIRKIDEREKMGLDGPPIRIGTAMFDRGRCLPWAMATECMVCEEHCPTSPKAIWVEPVDVPKRAAKHGPQGAPPEMLSVRVQRPHVDPALCVGCGVCEKVCPVVDKPAIYVTNAGESRSPERAILLGQSG